MPESLSGIHHITAITGDAQKNIDFYAGILGLRLVKLTVNFDDPGSYHLYYGDELGRPGTIMTFFAWPGAMRGRIGPPQVTVSAFAAPAGSLDFWRKRLAEKGVPVTEEAERFGEKVLGFADPDGLRLEIIGVREPKGTPWTGGNVPADQAIRAFHSATLAEEGYENTAKVLTDLMGFSAKGSDQNRYRYQAVAGSGVAGIVDVVCVPDARHGTVGAGAVHHIAFRTPDDPQQRAWRDKIATARLNVSPVMDRQYFHSIYYREPGGVLFEIATDTPGFTADQPAGELGKKLMLPPWLEKNRTEIEAFLPKLTL